MGLPVRIRHPRHRLHRRHDRKFEKFLDDMATRWLDQETRIAVTAVDDVNNELDMATPLPLMGPFDMNGAPPPEFRLRPQFWVEALASAFVFDSPQDAAEVTRRVFLAAWAETEAITGVVAGTDKLTVVAHGMETADGPVRFTTTDTLPAGIALATDYWIIKSDADDFQIATTEALAIAGTQVDITDGGTGTHTLDRQIDVGKDLSDSGLEAWLKQGIKPVSIQLNSTATPDATFK